MEGEGCVEKAGTEEGSVGKEDGREKQEEGETDGHFLVCSVGDLGGCGRIFHQLSIFLNVESLWRRLHAIYFLSI
jgi:hypothetical protein